MGSTARLLGSHSHGVEIQAGLLSPNLLADAIEKRTATIWLQV